MRNFKVLYYFSSPDYSLFETKRLDRPADAAPGEVYNWLLLEHVNKEVTNLVFKSMKKEGYLEFRSFQQAELSFDLSEAQLSHQGLTMVLNRRNPQDVSEDLTNTIEDFLFG